VSSAAFEAASVEATSARWHSWWRRGLPVLWRSRRTPVDTRWIRTLRKMPTAPRNL